MGITDIEARTFHGPVSADDFARALVAEFDGAQMRAKQLGRGDHRVVQITSIPGRRSGGSTAITIHITKIEDGVRVEVGEQEWIGVAASLGITALSFLVRPTSLVTRLDDLAVDINSLQLTTRIWEVIARTAENLGVSHQLSEKLRRLTCRYCLTANKVGAPHCEACGAPLGPDQPTSCQNCGYILFQDETACPQCGHQQPEAS